MYCVFDSQATPQHARRFSLLFSALLLSPRRPNGAGFYYIGVLFGGKTLGMPANRSKSGTRNAALQGSVAARAQGGGVISNAATSARLSPVTAVRE